MTLLQIADEMVSVFYVSLRPCSVQLAQVGVIYFDVLNVWGTQKCVCGGGW